MCHKNLLCALHYITWVALNKINASMTWDTKKARTTKGANWVVWHARDGLGWDTALLRGGERF